MAIPPANRPRIAVDPCRPRPIRMDWVERCCKVRGKALNLAMAIWSLAWLRGAPTVKLSGQSLARFGISRDACYPGLRRMEDARLITVWRLPGRAPMVTLVEPNGKPLDIRRGL